jgi:hypothetical protein
VDRSQAERVGELLLGHRQLIAIFFGKAVGMEPNRDLAQKMGEPRASVPPADVEHPFAKDRGLDQDSDQDGMADSGPRIDQLLEVLARDHRHLAAGQHLNAVIGNVEEKVLEIHRFTGIWMEMICLCPSPVSFWR